MSKKNIVFDASSRDYLMKANGLTVGFNMPKARKGSDICPLPPYRQRTPYLVDKFPSCPNNWMRSEGKMKSYFVPVVEDDGMWFDFNNNYNNTHHVAIVISVQGVNPITGLPCQDAQMEQYIEECPKHKIKFGPDRYCKKCNYKWPKQNYICTTSTPRGNLWLDGFRTAEGIVRQYILTSEKIRGVASNIIGKDRVYAVGISFFLSKDKKPELNNSSGVFRGMIMNEGCSIYHYPQSDPYSYHPEWDNNSTLDNFYNTSISCCSNSYDGPSFSHSTISKSKCGENSIKASVKLSKKSALSKLSSKTTPIKQTKNLEVGAGSKISQDIYDDTEKLDYWHDESEAIICINYCNESDAIDIIERGEIDLEGSEDGFLQGIPVGN